jgi:ion channel
MFNIPGIRRRFLVAFCRELRVVWPILSGLFAIQLVLGILVGRIEGWPMGDASYFAFVTGLTIGYGDVVPAHLSTRVIAVVIGFSGCLSTGLFAAVGVTALQETTGRSSG